MQPRRYPVKQFVSIGKEVSKAMASSDFEIYVKECEQVEEASIKVYRFSVLIGYTPPNLISATIF